ncbi:hypothetical protein LINPERPRIM_LOCUS30232 [Linum perenne]
MNPMLRQRRTIRNAQLFISRMTRKLVFDESSAMLSLLTLLIDTFPSPS